MEIKQLKLENIGRFRSLTLDLAPTTAFRSNVTVLIGNNGAGKTSVLKSLATSLSWFVARLRSDKGSGNPIPEDVISNEATTAAIDILLHNQETAYRWKLAKTRTGRKGTQQSQLSEASKLADEYRAQLSEHETTSLPLIAFYPVERVVLDIPLKIKERHSFLQLDGYDNSLNQGVDFRRFFEWFREREDSENESVIPADVLKQLEKTLDPSIWQTLQQQQASARDRQLTAVRVAIANFMPGFENLKVRRKPRLHMSIDKEGQTLNVLAEHRYHDGSLSRDMAAVLLQKEERVYNLLGQEVFQGMETAPKPISLAYGDVVVMMTDGVFRALTWREIEEVLESGGTPNEIAGRLTEAVRYANQQDKDNASVLIYQN